MTLLLGVQATMNCPLILMARKPLLCWRLRLNCSEKNAANKPRSSRSKKRPPPEFHKIWDLRSSLEAVESASSQPIAIVGMSCRAPGGVASPESYWSLLESGGDGVGPVPRRWSRELLQRLEVVTGGLAQEGGFIDAIEDFDAGFFGIAPREAVEMDPQQRLILEAVWEALERAGIRPEGLREPDWRAISARWLATMARVRLKR